MSGIRGTVGFLTVEIVSSGIFSPKRRRSYCDAGFPCQDVSTAGAGRGLAGERSGLFFEIVRVATRELPHKPKWLFLENVANIRKNGLAEVLRTLSDAG